MTFKQWLLWLYFICVDFIKYFVKCLRRLFNIITFKLYFAMFYNICNIVLVIWPFPILRGRNINNMKIWSRLLKHGSLFYRIKWELRNREVLAKNRGAVIVANHQSSLDVLGIFEIWDVIDKMKVVAKNTVLYAGGFGVITYFGDLVFIDRKNPKRSYKQLQTTAEVIKKKIKVWIFPEGTRNFDQTKLLPFKKGAFMMAVAAQAPIIPVVYSPYYFIDRKKYTFTKGRIIIQCLEEVPTIGLTMDDVPELAERVRGMMLATYKKLSEEVMPNTTNLDGL